MPVAAAVFVWVAGVVVGRTCTELIAGNLVLLSPVALTSGAGAVKVGVDEVEGAAGL